MFIQNRPDVSTANVTAYPDEDYEPITPRRVYFDPMDAEESVVLQILSDSIAEPQEVLKLDLSDPGQDETIGPVNTTFIIINDDDGKLVF